MADDDYNAVALMDEVAARNSGRDTAAVLSDINSRLSDVEDAFESPSFDVDWRSAVVPEDSVGGGGIFEETSLPFGYVQSEGKIIVYTGRLILRAYAITGKTTKIVTIAQRTVTVTGGTATVPYWIYVEHEYGTPVGAIKPLTSATYPESDATTLRVPLYSVYYDAVSEISFVVQRHQWGDILAEHDETVTSTPITGWRYDKDGHRFQLTTQVQTLLGGIAEPVGPSSVSDDDGGQTDPETV